MRLALLFAVELSARWFTGLEGARMADVAVAAGSGRRVFAVALPEASAVHRSEDGGSTWGRVFEPPEGESLVAVVPDPHDSRRVFAWTVSASAAGYSTSLYQSLDAGETWTFRRGVFGSSQVEIAFDLLVPGIVYVVYDDAFAFLDRSLDGGETFHTLTAPFAAAHLAAAQDGTLIASTADGATVMSVDQGQSWIPRAPIPVSPLCLVSTLAIDSGNPRVWYAGIASPLYPCGSVLRTDDGGASWNGTGSVGAPVWDLASDPVRPGVVYASTLPSGSVIPTGRVLASLDGGGTWTDLDLPLLGGARAISLTPDGSRVYAATDHGVFQRDLRRPKVSAPR